MKNDNNKNQEAKRGLAFIKFHKIRKTRDLKKVLVFINDSACVSVSVKYLEKVLADNKAGE